MLTSRKSNGVPSPVGPPEGAGPSDLIAFVGSLISSPEQAHSLAESIRQFHQLTPDEQQNRVPSVYLDLEQFLVEIDPCKRFLRDQLREIVRTRFPGVVRSIPALALVFQEPARQELLLCRNFLAQVCADASPLVWGSFRGECEQLIRWLGEIPATGPPPVYLGGAERPQDDQQWASLLSDVSRAFFDRLERATGERSATRLYDRVYESFAEQFITLDVFPVVISMLPEKLLDRTRVALHRFGSVRRVFLERTEQLHEINEQLLERNKELAEIRRELRTSKDELELRVEERTAELRSINERLSGEIQERERAEEALRASQQFARNIIDSSLDMIIAVDSERRVIEFNRAAEEIFGYSRQEVLGKEAGMFFADDKESASVHQLSKERGGFVREVMNRRKNGAAFPCLLSGSVLRDASGAPIGYMGVSRDISKQKELEQQLLQSQKMESIGLLAGGIAHDINNVLTPIVMSIDLLREKLTGEEDNALVDMIETSAKRGASIVKQILTIARRVEGERSEVQLRHLLKEMAKIATETFPKSITVRVDAASDLPPVLGDATQLHQVILNLAVNARDAMPSGGTLTFRGRALDVNESDAARHLDAQAGRYTVLEVCDTGKGIPKDVMPKIFEAFFTTKGPGRGTGLGLSTVHAIVRTHKGFIDVSSNESTGTTFSIYLPAVASSATEVPGPAETQIPSGRGEAILVVDDEPSVREITRRTLAVHGYRPFVASEGSEAVALYASKRADIRLVVTDLSMPVMDGFATIRAIRRINANVIIVATSGRSEHRAELEAENLDVAAFVDKPCTAVQLLKVISSVLSSNPAHAPLGSAAKTFAIADGRALS